MEAELKSPEELSKEQLIKDLIEMRRRVIELEKVARDRAEYEKELSSTKAMFEGLFEFAPDAIVVVNRAGRIVQVNKQTERLFGYTREELLKEDHDLLIPDRFKAKHFVDRAGYASEPRIRQMGTGLELYGRKKDGDEFPVDISLGPLQTMGEFVVLAVVRDFTERKKSLENLKRALADLQHANDNLESFTYSISHDLRTPLRFIRGYADMILGEHGDMLNEEARRKFKIIQDSVDRMDQLVLGTLALSRAGRQEINRADLDMKAIAQVVTHELLQTADQKTPEIIIHDLPHAWGDQVLIRQVFANLLSNAFKFTREREHPKIEVSGHSNSEIIYSIKDNGAGFDMSHADRLFDLFQRLHGEDQFEGIGAGLSIVKRIIERHGGRVWAEGKVNEGATFYFALPKGSG